MQHYFAWRRNISNRETVYASESVYRPRCILIITSWDVVDPTAKTCVVSQRARLYSVTSCFRTLYMSRTNWINISAYRHQPSPPYNMEHTKSSSGVKADVRLDRVERLNSQRRRTLNESTRSCDAVNVAATARLICLTLRSCWMSPTTGCSAIHCTILLTYCIHSSPQSTASQHYHLRRRTHDRQLPTQISHLCNKNFLGRALYKDSYWICTLCSVNN